MIDPYTALGLARSATETDIKKAYRQLAKKYHPDVNQDDPTAEDKFKEIGKAYELLKNPQKKQFYDQYGVDPDDQSNDLHQNQSHSVNMNSFSDIFNELFGQNGPHFGTGFGRRPAQRNPTIVTDLQISLEDVFTGKTVSVEMKIPGTPAKTLDIEIPKGVDGRNKLKLAGQGPQTDPTLPAGDVIVNIHVQEHSTFQRIGVDLAYNASISIIDAALGKSILVPTIDGTTIKVDLKAGTQFGDKFRLANKGLPYMRSVRRGDMYVIIKTTVPTNLSNRQKEILQEFEDESKT